MKRNLFEAQKELNTHMDNGLNGSLEHDLGFYKKMIQVNPTAENICANAIFRKMKANAKKVTIGDLQLFQDAYRVVQ